MARFQPSQYGEALWYEDPPRIPSVGSGRPYHRLPQVTPYDQIEEARQLMEAKRRAEVASALPGAPRLPTGPKDLVLLTSRRDDDIQQGPERLPLWERSWFWPVAIFSVAFGVIANHWTQK